MVALPGGLDPPFRSAPRHDGRRRGDIAFENLIPADQAASAGVQKLFDARRSVILQLARTPQPFGLHARLAMRALLPHHRRAFVAADMDVF